MNSGNKSVGGRVVFIFYSLRQSLWLSSATVNSIPKSTDSQDASSEARESVASHFSSTVTDEIGFLDDHETESTTKTLIQVMMQLMKKR